MESCTSGLPPPAAPNGAQNLGTGICVDWNINGEAERGSPRPDGAGIIPLGFEKQMFGATLLPCSLERCFSFCYGARKKGLPPFSAPVWLGRRC